VPIRFRALVPKKPLIVSSAVHSRLERALNDFVYQIERSMATYPVPMPTKSGYVRTMTLARSWSVVRAHMAGGNLVARAGSNADVAPYNRFVEGDLQTAEMRRRQWPIVYDVAQKLWPELRRAVQAAFRNGGA